MIKKNIQEFQSKIPENVTLVAVSKTKPIEDLQEAYDAGQRVLGENKILSKKRLFIYETQFTLNYGKYWNKKDSDN